MADIKIYGTLKNVTNEPIANAEQIGNLATVATSGSYNDLDDKPTIPTSISQLLEDSKHRTITDNEKSDYTYAAKQFIKYGIIDIKSEIYQWNHSQVNVNNDGLLIFEDYIIYNTTSVATISMYVTLTRNNENIPLISRQIDKFNNTILNESFDVKQGDIITCGCSGAFELGSENKAYLKYIISQKSLPTKTSDLTNDSGFLTEHQDISGKQDVLISGTNIKTINDYSIVGSGNLNVGTVTGVKINNVTKTPTNGTVDLGTVLTTTTSSVTNGSKIPITSGGVDSALQNYETKLVFTTSDSTRYTAQKNKYCRFTSTLPSLDISLPTSSLVAGDTCAFNFTTSGSFTITGGTIKKMKDFAIEANKTYEVVALYDGVKWLVTATEFE